MARLKYYNKTTKQWEYADSLINGSTPKEYLASEPISIINDHIGIRYDSTLTTKNNNLSIPIDNDTIYLENGQLKARGTGEGKEDVANKVNAITSSSTRQYPSTKAVIDYLRDNYDLSELEQKANKENVLSPDSTTKYPSSKAVADYVEEHAGSELTPATKTSLGGIKVGTGLDIAEDGTLSKGKFQINIISDIGDPIETDKTFDEITEAIENGYTPILVGRVFDSGIQTLAYLGRHKVSGHNLDIHTFGVTIASADFSSDVDIQSYTRIVELYSDGQNSISIPVDYSPTDIYRMIDMCQPISDKTTALSTSSTHTQYPSAKAVVDYIAEKAGSSVVYVNLDTATYSEIKAILDAGKTPIGYEHTVISDVDITRYFTLFQGGRSLLATMKSYTFGSPSSYGLRIVAIPETGDKVSENYNYMKKFIVPETTSGLSYGASSETSTPELCVIPANQYHIGGIKVGNGLSIESDGTLNNDLSTPFVVNISAVPKANEANGDEAEYMADKTYAEITEAINNGFVPVMKYGSMSGLYLGNIQNAHFFGATIITSYMLSKPQLLSICAYITSSGVVKFEQSNQTFDTFENKTNKVSFIDDQSTNNEYPSAKAVYDLVMGAIEGEY